MAECMTSEGTCKGWDTDPQQMCTLCRIERIRVIELQVDEYRRFCEEIVKSTETCLTFWKRRAQFSLDAMTEK